jgi:hypothetical protein
MSATHGREPIALAYEMAVRALQLGLTFRMHPATHNPLQGLVIVLAKRRSLLRGALRYR